jgi:excisionase family DNA binding protein
MTDAPEGDGLSVSEAAALLDLTTDQVRASLYNRRLRGEKVGHEWRVPRAEVDRYRQQHATLPGSDWLTVGQVADMLDVPVKRVRDLIYEGRLKGEKARDGNWRVTRDEVLRHQRAPGERTNPMFEEAEALIARREAAEKVAADLAAELDRAMLRWREQGQPMDAIASAFGYGNRESAARAVRRARDSRQ